MPRYIAYGLAIESDFDLPGLPESEGDAEADVWLRRGSLVHTDLSPRSNSGDTVLARVEGLPIYFFAENGRDITIDPSAELDESTVIGAILGSIMGTVLRQRGFLVLHASCVARGDDAIAFAGCSGWGKSTTAEYFHQNGYRLISDDVLAVRVGETIEVLPGYPLIKLRPDAGTALRHDFAEMPHVSNDAEKRLHQLGSFDTSPVTLRRLYLLRGENAPAIRIAQVTPQQAMRELIGHTLLITFLTSPAYMQRHLQQCARVSTEVTVQALERVRRLDALPEIKRIVEADLADVAAEAVGAHS